MAVKEDDSSADPDLANADGISERENRGEDSFHIVRPFDYGRQGASTWLEKDACQVLTCRGGMLSSTYGSQEKSSRSGVRPAWG